MTDPLREQFDQIYALANEYFGDVIDVSPPTPPSPAELAERYKTLGSSFLTAYDLEVGKLIDSNGRYPFNQQLWRTYGRVAVKSMDVGRLLNTFETMKAGASNQERKPMIRSNILQAAARRRFWQGVTIEEPAYRSSRVPEWGLATLEHFKYRPLTTTDMAKVLFGEQFASVSINTLQVRANNGVFRSVKIREALFERGLELESVESSLEKIYVCKEIGEAIKVDRTARPTDDELRTLAIQLRQAEPKDGRKQEPRRTKVEAKIPTKDWRIIKAEQEMGWERHETEQLREQTTQQDMSWGRHEKEQQGEGAAQTRLEISTWKQDEYAYEKREQVQNRLKRLAAFFKNYTGQYLTYDDILPVLTESIDPQRSESARTFVYTVFSKDLLTPFLEDEGLMLHQAHYQIYGKGRSRAVFVCLPESEEPAWSDEAPRTEEEKVVSRMTVSPSKPESGQPVEQPIILSTPAVERLDTPPPPEKQLSTAAIKAGRVLIRLIPKESLKDFKLMRFSMSDPALLEKLRRQGLITSEEMENREISYIAAAVGMVMTQPEIGELLSGSKPTSNLSEFTKALDAELQGEIDRGLKARKAA